MSNFPVVDSTPDTTRLPGASASIETPSLARKGRHALVLGGSLAGLLAARVLSDHYDSVTIIEKDALPNEATPRKGVPQMNHVHALLVRGREILEQLFPGLNDEMMKDGAPLLDMANDLTWLTPGGWGVRFESDLRMLAFTRPLLDLHVRRRLSERHHVEVFDKTEVVRLLSNRKKLVVGAVVKTFDSKSGEYREAKVPAELVVDATGRGSKAGKWLQELGHAAPKETVINAHTGYASRLYQIPEGFTSDWCSLFIQANPPKEKRGGLLLRVEGNRWLVTLVGGDHDYPPTSEEEFLEFARSLRSPLIYDAIKNAEPLTPIRGYRGTENRWRHFERTSDLPTNFIGIGDSVCAFNPVYGHGLTIASIGAMTLQECLKEGSVGSSFSRRFHQRLAKVNETPWTLATGEDMRYEGTEGAVANRRVRFMHWYMNQVFRLASFDPDVRLVLLKVFGMVVKPTSLFQPRIVFSILVQALGFVRAKAIMSSNLARNSFRVTTANNNPQGNL
jgi:2-polyprenyl-6-methoxyphenol hydroxylase-like FAD-dependent oxidoreductase